MVAQDRQQRLERVRPPRVRIAYEVAVGDVVEKKELPFVIGVLGDFSGSHPMKPLPPLRERRFLQVDRDNFNEVLAAQTPGLAFRVDDVLTGQPDCEIGIQLTFRHIDDFRPEIVAAQIPATKSLLDERNRLLELRSSPSQPDNVLGTELEKRLLSGDSNRTGKSSVADRAAQDPDPFRSPPDLLDQIIAATLPEDRRTDDLLQIESASQKMIGGENLPRTIDSWVALIDQKVSEQVNLVLHHPSFQKLEASWRGLYFLVDRTETSPDLKIRVLNVSKRDLCRDLEMATEFDMSSIFQKVYTDEFEVFGGNPFGCLIGDYEFSNHLQDVELLGHMAMIAATAHAPFISAAAPQLFGLESFVDIGKPRELARIFQSVEYVRWNSFRESADSGYIGLVMPHMLMRLPYGPASNPVDEFNFQEDVDTHNLYLWANAAYAFGTRLTEAFSRHGWLARIRGVENGGIVEGLPTHVCNTDDGQVNMKCPAEVEISSRREMELSNLGFIPLIHCRNTDYAVFFSTNSCHKPAKYTDPEATAKSRLSNDLRYLLCVSRFAQCLAMMCHDRCGRFMEPQDGEKWLNRWIVNYVLGNPEMGSDAAKAHRPLREAKIEVQDDHSRPGRYLASAYLCPHFQFEELPLGFSVLVRLGVNH